MDEYKPKIGNHEVWRSDLNISIQGDYNVNAKKVEFNYLANFLGMKPEKIFYEKNKKLLDSLISNRINRNKALLVNIESAFKERFG
jgi:hypothetical protein